MTLKEEIEQKSKEIFTDSYKISFGELMSMYKDEEMNLHPDFQRLFRWSNFQKSRLIESILLGIPIPSIFVSQEEDGKWDIVDGLQRLSTIFQFAGILKDENGQVVTPLKLQKTKLLPSLEGVIWKTIESPLMLDIKRSKIDVQIVQKKSDNKLKYELFQRLNTLGSRLSDQELRNCLMIMTNKSFFEWVQKLSNNENFLNTISLSDKLLEEKYHMELVLRFLVFKNSSLAEIKSSNDISDFISEKTQEMALNQDFNLSNEESTFSKVFKILNMTLEDDTFKKYYPESKSFKGKFLISSFEAITIGLSKNINQWDETTDIDTLKEKLINIWSESTFTGNIGAGANFFNRIPKIMPFSEEFFKNENQN